jgi:hypothetical protein
VPSQVRALPGHTEDLQQQAVVGRLLTVHGWFDLPA